MHGHRSSQRPLRLHKSKLRGKIVAYAWVEISRELYFLQVVDMAKYFIASKQFWSQVQATSHQETYIIKRLTYDPKPYW